MVARPEEEAVPWLSFGAKVTASTWFTTSAVGKMQQLHLARLGEQAAYHRRGGPQDLAVPPVLDLDWSRLRRI